MENKAKTRGVFDQMINAVSNRDEKAALEALKKQMIETEDRAEAAERKVAELQAALAKAQADNKAQSMKTQESNQEQLSKLQSELLSTKSQMSMLEQRAKTAETENLRLLRMKRRAHCSKPLHLKQLKPRSWLPTRWPQMKP